MSGRWETSAHCFMDTILTIEEIVRITRPLLHKFMSLDMPPSNKQYCSSKTKFNLLQDKKKKVARQNRFCYVTNSFLSCSKRKKHKGKMWKYVNLD